VSEAEFKLQKQGVIVSVIVPVHNRAKAEKCAEHVRKQTYPNVELIIVDFKGFPAEKRNYGYLKSKGEYVFFLDEDEYLSPSTISKCVDKFNEGFDLVGILQHNVQPKGYLAKCISATNIGSGPDCKFYKRNILNDVGLFCPKYIFCDDVDMHNRILRKGYRLGIVDCEDAYIMHDSTSELTSTIRKTLLSRKPYRLLEKKYAKVERDTKSNTRRQRKTIRETLLKQPSLILGVSIVMLSCFLVRRIP
jgi:glycosyltransferase involved in cell wall biosynthesis